MNHIYSYVTSCKSIRFNCVAILSQFLWSIDSILLHTQNSKVCMHATILKPNCLLFLPQVCRCNNKVKLCLTRTFINVSMLSVTELLTSKMVVL